MLFLDDGYGFGMMVVGGKICSLAFEKKIRGDILDRRRR